MKIHWIKPVTIIIKPKISTAEVITQSNTIILLVMNLEYLVFSLKKSGKWIARAAKLDWKRRK